jgi:hypothetical protein
MRCSFAFAGDFKGNEDFAKESWQGFGLNEIVSH